MGWRKVFLFALVLLFVLSFVSLSHGGPKSDFGNKGITLDLDQTCPGDSVCPDIMDWAPSFNGLVTDGAWDPINGWTWWVAAELPAGPGYIFAYDTLLCDTVCVVDLGPLGIPPQTGIALDFIPGVATVIWTGSYLDGVLRSWMLDPAMCLRPCDSFPVFDRCGEPLNIAGMAIDRTNHHLWVAHTNPQDELYEYEEDGCSLGVMLQVEAVPWQETCVQNLEKASMWGGLAYDESTGDLLLMATDVASSINLSSYVHRIHDVDPPYPGPVVPSEPGVFLNSICFLGTPTNRGFGIAHVDGDSTAFFTDSPTLVPPIELNKHPIPPHIIPPRNDSTSVWADTVMLFWTNFDPDADNLEIYRDCALIDVLTGSPLPTTYIDGGVSDSVHIYHEVATVGSLESALSNQSKAVVHPSYIAVLEEDFESGAPGWVTGTSWQIGEPLSVWPHSPDSVAATVLLGCYKDSDCSYLTSPVVNLDSCGVLVFKHWYEMDPPFDGGNVQISTDGGGTWNLLTPVDGYPFTIDGSNLCIPGEPGYSATSREWEPAIFDLSAYPGDTVIFRWAFGSNASVAYHGWYVDDVQVHTGSPPCLTGVEEKKLEVRVSRFVLFQNTPNPVTHEAMIRYQLPVGTRVSLKIYDVTGRLLETLVDRRQEPGSYRVEWKAEDTSSGIYFYRLEAGDFAATKKLIRLR